MLGRFQELRQSRFIRGGNGVSGEKYIWTTHSRMKMRHYRLTEARVKRIIRFPTRVEEGVLDNGIACMQPAGGKNYSEIWTLYLLTKEKEQKKIKIITAWRYPGKSPARDPVPGEILAEVRKTIHSI